MRAVPERSSLAVRSIGVIIVPILIVVAEAHTQGQSGLQPRRQLPQINPGSVGEEGWSYPLMVLRDPVRNIIRIYGQYSVKVIGNETDRGETTQFAGCAMKGDGKEELVHNVEKIHELMRWDDNMTENIMHTANYVIDCHDPGSWAKQVIVRLQNGDDIGRWMDIIDMPGKRLGRLSVCSQPLITHRAWLRDWVDYQFQIGADEVFMHVPNGVQIDELFSSKRDERLKFNLNLAERTPANTGKEPLRRFVRNNTVWQDYWPSPAAEYYAEPSMFSACHYRNRYAYDYSIQFDIDEFWTPTDKSKEKLLPDFLDKHMEEKSTQMIFQQKNYPLDCQIRSDGEYSTRFTLKTGQEGQVKPALRPFTVLRMHVHGILDTEKEYKAKYGWEAASQDAPIELAYLKHIRPMNWVDGDGKAHLLECRFGRQSDPDGQWLTVDD